MKRRVILALSLCLLHVQPVLAEYQHMTPTSADSNAVEHVELSLPQGLLSGFPVINQSISMDAAVQMGLQNSTGIQVAEAETGIRQALLRRAQAKGWPVLSVGSNTFLHNRDNQTLMTQAMMMTTGQGTFFQDLNASARMPLFTGGQIRAGTRASRFSLEGALAGRQQAAVDVAYQIREAYLKSLLSHAEHLVHQQHITVQEELLHNAEARYQTGRGLKTDVLRILTEIASARQMLNEEHHQLNNSLFDLKAAMGIDLGSEIMLSDLLSFQPWPGPQLPELIKAAVVKHPRIQEAESAVKEAQAQIWLAKATYLPQVYGQVTGNLRFRADPPMMGNGVVGMVNVSLPVFDRNLEAEIAEATARLKRSQQELKARSLDLGKSVAQAWTDMQFAQDNVALAEAAVNQAQEDFRLIRRRAEVGRAIQVEVQDAALKLREAGLNRATTIYNHELAKARLEQALGKIQP